MFCLFSPREYNFHFVSASSTDHFDFGDVKSLFKGLFTVPVYGGRLKNSDGPFEWRARWLPYVAWLCFNAPSWDDVDDFFAYSYRLHCKRVVFVYSFSHCKYLVILTNWFVLLQFSIIYRNNVIIRKFPYPYLGNSVSPVQSKCLFPFLWIRNCSKLCSRRIWFSSHFSF